MRPEDWQPLPSAQAGENSQAASEPAKTVVTPVSPYQQPQPGAAVNPQGPAPERVFQPQPPVMPDATMIQVEPEMPEFDIEPNLAAELDASDFEIEARLDDGSDSSIAPMEHEVNIASQPAQGPIAPPANAASHQAFAAFNTPGAGSQQPKAVYSPNNNINSSQYGSQHANGAFVPPRAEESKAAPSSPPQAPPPSSGGKAGKSGKKGMGWPMAFLLFGVAIIGGCCYSFTKMLDSVAPDIKTAKPGVGVLVMEDEIFGSIWATDVLHKFKNDPNIKSVVIRINSPGGAVAPCQEIYQSVKNLNKPVVISMGSVAASGGLYVAAAGNHIMANPGTITGSIGVIMQSVEVTGTMKKIGLTSQTIKSGEFKDMGSPFRELKANERELLQTMVNEVYEQFIADLVRGRLGDKGMKEEDIRKMADGRIFSGSEAMKLGLIDELGGFEDAIMKAAVMGKLPASERPALYIEDGRKPWWESVMQSKLNTGVQINIPPAFQPGFSIKYIYQPDLNTGSH